MSRPKGIINLTAKQIETIILMSGNPSNRRRSIAEATGCSKRTVYLWQKKLYLL